MGTTAYERGKTSSSDSKSIQNTEEKMESELDKLKIEWEGWKKSITLRRQQYIYAKQFLKEAQQELKEAKYLFGQTYKNWKKVRQEAVRAERRFKNYPYKMRQWAKEHIGEVLKMFEEGK